MSAATTVWARTRALLPRHADLHAMRRNPRRDLLAGVTVAFVALPLALAFGVASGGQVGPRGQPLGLFEWDAGSGSNPALGRGPC